MKALDALDTLKLYGLHVGTVERRRQSGHHRTLGQRVAKTPCARATKLLSKLDEIPRALQVSSVTRPFPHADGRSCLLRYEHIVVSAGTHVFRLVARSDTRRPSPRRTHFATKSRVHARQSS